MKPKFSIYPLLLLAGLFSAACQNEDDLYPSQEVDPPLDLSVPADSSIATPNAKYGCTVFVLPSFIRFNYIRNSYGGCTYRYLNICSRPERVVSIPCITRIPDLIPPDVCLSCPFIIAKFLPGEIFEDFRKINPEIIKLKANGVTFPITKSVVGIQFYAENEIINRKGFILRNNLPLSAEEQKILGVSGKIISAGQYPVIHNPKNNTFNAIVAIK